MKYFSDSNMIMILSLSSSTSLGTETKEITSSLDEFCCNPSHNNCPISFDSDRK